MNAIPGTAHRRQLEDATRHERRCGRLAAGGRATRSRDLAARRGRLPADDLAHRGRIRARWGIDRAGRLGIGAQTMRAEESGAYTGESSAR